MCLAVARLLGGSARGIALDDEQLGPFRIVLRAVGELARQPKFAAAGGCLALDLAFGPALQTLVHAVEHEGKQRAAAVHVVGQEMIEMVANRILDQTGGIRAGQPILGLALILRLPNEDRQHDLGTGDDVVSLDILHPLLADQLAERSYAPGERRPDALFVRPAVGRRDGVAIIRGAVLAPQRPGDRPFHHAMVIGEVLPPLEEFAGRAGAVGDLLLQMVGQAAGKLEHSFGRRLVRDQRRIAFPAYLDAGEQIGLGPREAVEARRFELRVLAEDFEIGNEGDAGAPAVRRRAQHFESGGRLPPRKGLAVEFLVAGDLDDRLNRQRVDDADADPVQAARGGIGLVREFAARVELGEDDLEGVLAGIFGVLVDRHPAAVVDDSEAIALFERHLDPRGIAGHSLVHRIVEDFGGEVMERALVDAADIHAGPPANRLEPLKNLDRGGVILAGGGCGGREQV